MKKIQLLLLLFSITLTTSYGQVATCVSNVTAVLGIDQQITISPYDLDAGSYNYDSLSSSQTVFTCDDIGTHQVVLYAHNDTIVNSCTVEVEIIDLIAPAIQCTADGYVIALDSNGQATIAPDDIIDFVFDNCQNYTASVSPNSFDANDGPEENVTVTVTDGAGNQTSCTTVAYIGGVPQSGLTCLDSVYVMVPAGENVVIGPSGLLTYGPLPSWDLDVILYDTNNEVIPNNELTDDYWGQTLSALVIDSVTMASCITELTVGDIVLNCTGDKTLNLPIFGDDIELHPSDFIASIGVNYDSLTITPSVLGCSDLGDNVVTVAMYIGNESYTCETNVTIVDNAPPVAICDVNTTIFLGLDGTATITPEMVDNGSYDACNNFTMEVIPSVIDSSDIPEGVDLIVTDAAGNTSSCFVTINVIGAQAPNSIACNTGVTFTLPTSGSLTIEPSDILEIGPFLGWDVELTMTVDGQPIPNNELTVAHVGKTILCEVHESNSNLSCWGEIFVVATSFNDCSGFFICDNAPWDTEAGECSSGHSFADGVEWPRNLEIEGCYYSPEYLMNYSFVNSYDAAPRLVETCDDIKTKYKDTYTNNNDGTIIHRTWTIIDETNNMSYSYTQNISTITYGCELEVLTTDRRNTPMQTVHINDAVVTDMDGKASISALPQESILNPSYLSSKEAGVDIHDIVQLGEYETGISALSAAELTAADINLDGEVNVLDLNTMMDISLGAPAAVEPIDWKFASALGMGSRFSINNLPIATGDFFGTATHAIGIKPGDINADALHFGQAIDEIQIAPTIVSIKDQLLNNGENYTVDIFVENISAVAGQQMDIQFDPTKFSIAEVTSEVLPGFSSEHYRIIDENTLRIVWVGERATFYGGGVNLSEDTPLFSLTINCTGNAILSASMDLSNSNRNSMARLEDNDRYAYRLEWIDKIISTTIDPSGLDRRVILAPNPAKSIVNVEVKNGTFETYKISLFNSVGQEVLSKDGAAINTIDVTRFSSGLYQLIIQGESGFYSQQKLIISQ